MVEIDWRDDTKYHTVPQEIGNTTQCVKIMEIPTKVICTLQEQGVKGEIYFEFWCPKIQIFA